MGFVVDKNGVAGIEKDPDSVLDYKIDWTPWLGADEIANSTWTVSDPTLVVGVTNHSQTQAVVWLSGGVAGAVYTVTNHITTSGGRQEDRSFEVICREL